MRVKYLVIKSSGEPGQRPRSIKLFINRPSLGFDDVQDAQEPYAAQILELTDEQVAEGKKIPLRFVRFQNVSSLHVSTNDLFHSCWDSCAGQIFVASNGGDDETRIDGIDLFGSLAG